MLPWRIVEAREVREQESVSVLGCRSVYAEAQDRGAQAEQRGGGRLGEPCPSVHQHHVIAARPLVARQGDQSAYAFKVRMTEAGVVDEAAAELRDDGPRSFAGGAAERGQDIHGATPPGQLRLAHASLDQLAFGIRTQARFHQPVENAELRQVLLRQQQSADAGGFQVEIHHQHIAPALGLVRCENRHGTGPADTALDAVKCQNRRDAGKRSVPANGPILAHDTPVDDGNPPPFGIGARGCDVDLLLHSEIVSERRIEQVAGDSDRRDRRVASQGMSAFGIEASHRSRHRPEPGAGT